MALRRHNSALRAFGISLVVSLVAGACQHPARFQNLPSGYWNIDDIERQTTKTSLKTNNTVYAASFDEQGHLHLIYNSQEKLRYLKKGPSDTDFKRKTPEHIQWINFPVNAQNSQISLNIDKSDRPHVVHSGPQGLRYHILHEPGWILGLITDHAQTTHPWQMLFNGHDVPLLIMEHHDEGIALMQPTTQGWSEELAITQSEIGHAEMACFGARLDISGGLQISYLLKRDHRAQLWIKNQSTTSFHDSIPWPNRARRNNTPWQSAQLLASWPAHNIESCRISWDFTGAPSCLWLNQQKNKSWNLTLTEKKSSGVSHALLSKSSAHSPVAADFTLTKDTLNNPHILWHFANEPWLYYATRDEKNQWKRSVINQETIKPQRPLLILNKKNKPFVIFNDTKTNDLKYAWPKN